MVCSFGAGSLGAVATITVDAHVTAPSGTSLSAVAAVSSSTVDGGPGDNTVTVETTVA